MIVLDVVLIHHWRNTYQSGLDRKQSPASGPGYADFYAEVVGVIFIQMLHQ